MVDINLLTLMHGQGLEKRGLGGTSTSTKKTRFELETEKEIDKYLKSLDFDQNDPSNRFLSATMKYSKIREELKEEAKLSELSGYITTAIHILNSEGLSYLDKPLYNLMIEDFSKGLEALEQNDLNAPLTENLQSLLHLPTSTIESILTVAVNKFKENKYPDSLAIFLMLATLIPENADYWYRSGVVAQRNEEYDLALRLYTAAIDLDPELIGAWLFSAECNLKLGLKKEAVNFYAEAIKISEIIQIKDEWRDFLSDLGAKLGTVQE